ncbi:MAG: DnaJ domain-containing protein [Roseovarius sp.]|nr:DnaJ domain-containing protein [Roseovarius sp.]MCY4207314.1 DnaJ domain-containing protein [Roseovarius sp.]MCY4292226.1 DnaJ domain-containing protein [Roseovarius sp.]MCY4315576.1 DnaJ domain-containing protein [Roseovarius sp.]
MPKSDPFGFDMSVSSAKKNASRKRRIMSGASETSTRTCDKEGCNKPGIYRAPKSRDALDEFFWFCVEHVREYNKQWNFYDDSSEAEINEQRSKDNVWQRETRSIKDHEARAWARLGIEDPHQVLGSNATQNPGKAKSGQRKLPPAEARAIEILEADATWSKTEIRKAYKSLIKILHPDINGGDRSQEEQMQEVVWAWEQISKSRNFK